MGVVVAGIGGVFDPVRVNLDGHGGNLCGLYRLCGRAATQTCTILRAARRRGQPCFSKCSSAAATIVVYVYTGPPPIITATPAASITSFAVAPDLRHFSTWV